MQFLFLQLWDCDNGIVARNTVRACGPNQSGLHEPTIVCRDCIHAAMDMRPKGHVRPHSFLAHDMISHFAYCSGPIQIHEGQVTSSHGEVSSMDCLPSCQDFTMDLKGVVYLCSQANRSWFDGLDQANSLAWKIHPLFQTFEVRMESILYNALLESFACIRNLIRDTFDDFVLSFLHKAAEEHLMLLEL